jgi:chromosome partitioning protein
LTCELTSQKKEEEEMATQVGRLIALANTKGGVGKSTIAGNLAWAFATQEGSPELVLLVDADPQASITKWFDLAESVPFDRTQLTTARVLQQQLPRLRKQYGIILVDCPPMQSDVTAAGVTQADLGLVPVQPSPLDMLAYSELVPLLRQAQGFNVKLKLRFVVNQLSSRTTLGNEVQESLADADIPLLPTMIHDRQIYRRVVAQGSSVVTEPGPGRDEILALAKDVIHALESRDEE